MAIRPIIIAPDPRLKKRAQPVESVDAELRRLMDDLLETMYAAPGVGLAAPQLGVLKRIIVVDAARKDEPPRDTIPVTRFTVMGTMCKRTPA